MTRSQRIAGSFRDPGGSVFRRDGVLLRQINEPARADFQKLTDGPLYQQLIDAGLLISHDETDIAAEGPTGWRVIRPREIGFISYPYEWCFSQLKDAAKATLEIQKKAIEQGMWLKDASAYNIQFDRGRPILIDTLSLEIWRDGEPWPAYRQFCQHFLAPLALMSKCDARMGRLLEVHLDGIPLDLAAALLPMSARFRPTLLFHLFLHARMDRRHAGDVSVSPPRQSFTKMKLLGLIDNLESAVAGLQWSPAGTEWGGYYHDTNYTAAAMDEKRKIVAEMIESARPANVWDLGANTGEFSRIASDRGIPTIAFDIDPAAVELNYRKVRETQETNLLPLLMDLTNPSPAIGWANAERMDLSQRGPADLAVALALVHHLAISGNVPLGHIADFLHSLSRKLIIEFVPKSDSQVARLFVVRKDIFTDYTPEAFEAEFGRRFTILRRQLITGTQRTLYLMERRETA